MADKIVLSSEMVYIQEALKDGRATIQPVSMKALGTPDPAFQARVNFLNMDHVQKKLGPIVDAQGDLGPIVVFRLPSGRLIIVNGIHRWKLAQVRKMSSIRAYVIDGTEDDAKMFAAMANQDTLLERTPQDKRKAVLMLFSVPGWIGRSDRSVAAHVGVSPLLVNKLRAEYAEANGVTVPELLTDSKGVFVKTFVALSPGIQCWVSADGQYKAKIAGEIVCLGRDRDRAKARAEELTSGLEQSLRSTNLKQYFLNRGIHFVSISESNLQGVRGFHGYGLVLTPVRGLSKDSICTAVGCVILTSVYLGNPNAQPAVIVGGGVDPRVRQLALKAGVIFMTPADVVKRVKGEELPSASV